MNKPRDVVGSVFGKLTITKVWTVRTNGGRAVRFAECLCGVCGKVRDSIRLSHVTRGQYKACGCLRGTGNKTHGLSRTTLYKKWKGMHGRCYNPNSKKFKDYGGRGIIVCSEWNGDNGFINFHTWARGNGYIEGLTIDRENVNGNYEPSNCRWTNNTEQARNRRNNIEISYNGETKCLIEWSEVTGISWGVLRYRIIDQGWSTERAFTTPVRVFKSGNQSKYLQK